MILHIDLNSYFATVEQQANPFLRGKPIGVAGKNINRQRTVVAAASIEAKRFGVKSGMSVWEARELCPSIILVEADYDRYLECSQRFYRILEHYSAKTEIFSIDEAFLEIKASRTKCRTIANSIKLDLRAQLGEWVSASIGIAQNKFLAKLASESQKPDGLTIAITKEEQHNLFARVKLSDFCGIGPRILRRLNSLGIYTPSELTAYSCQLLVAEFGNHWGTRLSEMGQGIDHSVIVTQGELSPEQSFGHSYTLPKWASDLGSAWTVLSRLSDQVARRMRKAGFLGRTLFVHLGLEEGGWLGARETYRAPINDGREIFHRSRSLLEQKLAVCHSPYAIRHLGVTMTNLVPAPGGLAIFPEDRRRARILPAIDALWDRYGPWSVIRADQLEASRILEPIPDGRTKRPILR